MIKPFKHYVCPLFKFLCAFMLSLSLAITPAFAIPKSPFLGANDDSTPRIHLLPQASFDSAEMSLLPQANLQLMASTDGFYSLNNVSMFHGWPCNGWCAVAFYSIVSVTIVIPPLLAIGGQISEHYTVRNIGNLMLYPWLLFPATQLYDDFLRVLLRKTDVTDNYVPDMNDYIGSISFLATSTGMILATTGQAIGRHKLRNSGNFTYLGGIVLLLAAYNF